MNQEQIKVVLKEIDDRDVLIFYVNEIEQPKGLSVNLNLPEGQNELKEVFSALLIKLENTEISLELEIDEEYSKGLYRDVCTEYINDLNDELVKVHEKIRSVLN